MRNHKPSWLLRTCPKHWDIQNFCLQHMAQGFFTFRKIFAGIRWLTFRSQAFMPFANMPQTPVSTAYNAFIQHTAQGCLMFRGHTQSKAFMPFANMPNTPTFPHVCLILQHAAQGCLMFLTKCAVTSVHAFEHAQISSVQ